MHNGRSFVSCTSMGQHQIDIVKWYMYNTIYSSTNAYQYQRYSCEAKQWCEVSNNCLLQQYFHKEKSLHFSLFRWKLYIYCYFQLLKCIMNINTKVLLLFTKNIYPDDTNYISPCFHTNVDNVVHRMSRPKQTPVTGSRTNVDLLLSQKSFFNKVFI